MSTEQIAALRSSESVDWKCRTCTGTSKKKRNSYILPADREEDENTDSETLTHSVHTAIVNQIRREVIETIRIEIQNNMQFYSDKIDDYEQKMKCYEERAKKLDNQSLDLKNQVQNLKVLNQALEQRVNEMEQSMFNNQIEICGIEEKDNEDLKEITTQVCVAFNLKPEDIIKAYRKKGRAKKGSTNQASLLPTPIVVGLLDGRRDLWLSTCKDVSKTCKDIGRKEDQSRIYLREALSHQTAFLLWKAKRSLKENNLYKYVWCKYGRVQARKDDATKIVIIRNEGDIEKLMPASTSGWKT